MRKLTKLKNEHVSFVLEAYVLIIEHILIVNRSLVIIVCIMCVLVHRFEHRVGVWALMLFLIFPGYYIGMCFAAPDKNLASISQVGPVLTGAASLCAHMLEFSSLLKEAQAPPVFIQQ